MNAMKNLAAACVLAAAALVLTAAAAFAGPADRYATFFDHSEAEWYLSQVYGPDAPSFYNYYDFDDGETSVLIAQRREDAETPVFLIHVFNSDIWDWYYYENQVLESGDTSVVGYTADGREIERSAFYLETAVVYLYVVYNDDRTIDRFQMVNAEYEEDGGFFYDLSYDAGGQVSGYATCLDMFYNVFFNAMDEDSARYVCECAYNDDGSLGSITRSIPGSDADRETWTFGYDENGDRNGITYDSGWMQGSLQFERDGSGRVLQTVSLSQSSDSDGPYEQRVRVSYLPGGITQYEELLDEDYSGGEDYAEEDYTEENYAEEECSDTMYDHETFNVLPYSDGIAWIQYGDRDDPVTSAVDTSGNILFTLNGSIRYMSPFSDGYAYYAASDDEGVYEVIVDKHGNICWIADRANNEHIIAGGDREFVVERHTTGFDSDYMEIGTVDPYGNTIQAYAHEINGTAYNESMHLDSTFCHPLDVYSKVEGSGHRSLSRYMGDHLYCLSGKILYNPQLGVLYYRDSLDIWPEETSNGRFRTLQTDYGNPELPRASLFDAGMNMLASQPYYYYERTGQGAYGLEWPEHDYTDDVYYRDGLYYANHCYWDDANNIALHIAGYPDRDMQGGPFYDGKAVLWIEGADGQKYVTVIDTAGNILFDPVQAHSSFFTIWNGYFLVEETQWNWCIYDTAGNRIRSVTDDIMPYNEYGAVEYSDISEGFMTVTYHDKKLKMLYSIHNAVNDHVKIPGVYEPETEEPEKDYTYIPGFFIEGKWLSTGSYGFGQAAPGAVVAFDGINCNLCSPQDTYAFYPDGDWYSLTVTGFSGGDSQTFTVKTIDTRHIDLIGSGGYITELERVD